MRSKVAGATLALAVGLLLCATPGEVRADALDEAFVAGNAAAADADWDTAAEEYRRAASLSSEPNATLAYNLGTAYLHQGELGRATYHLRRALESTSTPSVELQERARYNLQIARRRAELSAAAEGAKIDRPETWWDLVVEALGARGVAWASLACGWLALFVLWVHRRRQARGARTGSVTGAILVVLVTCYLGPGILHGLAVRDEQAEPEAIVVSTRVEAREGPGSHRKVQFELQGGASVRIVDRTPGWRRVRLPGGLAGWVPEKAVARLDGRGVTGGSIGAGRAL